MGTVCILLGLIVLILFTFGGFMISHAIIGNQTYMTLLFSGDSTKVYTMVVGLCFAVGLLICLSLVMNGLIYNRVSKSHNLLKRLTKH